MKRVILILILYSSFLFSDTIDSLLQDYETTSHNSLSTVDENLGHVRIYSQKEIRLMQYNKLSDILKELPLINLNKNRFGLSSPSLAGSKTTVGGCIRFLLNDHEVSSVHSQSASLSWGDLPLDFVDHVEIYYGDSSFALGNETGIYFVRIYTKSAKKENASVLKATVTNKSVQSQSFTHSESLDNGWAYLLFLNSGKTDETNEYKANNLNNNEDRRYLFFDLSNDTTRINLGYTDVKKDNYMGLSLDAVPDSGKIESKDVYLDINKTFLDDHSLKANFSIDINNRVYEETNATGIGLIPVLDLANMGLTIPKEFSEDLRFTKMNGYLSKSYDYKKHNLLTTLNFSSRKYEVKDRKTVNFANQTTYVGGFNDFNKEDSVSLSIQDNYKIYDNLVLIANAKVDKYKRNGYLEDTTEELFRLGTIFTPSDNFGLKSFYTETYLLPSFYNIDFADKQDVELETQKYKFYTLEGVFTTENSKFGVVYHDVRIKDFIYLTPVGFVNIDHTIETHGLIFNYEYNFSSTNKLKLSYYTTHLSETVNNSNKGGDVKFMGKFQNLEYFTSLIYKNAYEYKDVKVRETYDLSLGATYYFSKDLSLSIKGVNLLDKSTKSLYSEGFPGTSFALEDYERSVNFTLKWVF